MSSDAQKLPVVEKVGYSLGDAGANFVFQTMILFQLNFYTDTMGIAAAKEAGIPYQDDSPEWNCMPRSGINLPITRVILYHYRASVSRHKLCNKPEYMYK